MGGKGDGLMNKNETAIEFIAYKVDKKTKRVKVIGQDNFWFHGINLKNIKHVIEKDCCTYHVMRYTGLKDRNGIRIFEGHKVTLFGKVCQIKFEKGCFLAHIVDDTVNRCFSIIETETEIIGNIFQNPELMKAGK